MIIPYLGYSIISYTETNHADLSTSALTAKVAFVWSFTKSKKFELNVNSFINAIPVSSSSTITYTGNDIPSFRMLGANARLGYKLINEKSRFGAMISVGFYYVTTLVSNGQYADSPFGFSGVAGPQVYPSFSFRITDRNSIATYFKYSPLSSGVGVMALGNRDLSGGFSWTYLLGQKKRPVIIGLDYSNLKFELDSTSGTTLAIAATAITTSVGIGF